MSNQMTSSVRNSGPRTGRSSAFPKLLDELDAERIPFALLRDDPNEIEQLDELDLLVWPAAKRRFAALARKQGFVRCRNRIPLKEVYARYDAGAIRFLDVHYALVQAGVVYQRLPDPDEQDGRRLAVEDELSHLLFHNLLGKQGLQQKHLPRIETLIAEADREQMRARLSHASSWPRIAEVLDDPHRFRAGSEAAAATARSLRRDLLKSPGNALRHLYCRFLHDRLRSFRGLHVAFVGVDGAGKTTTIDLVSRNLADTRRVPFANVYMGPWGQFRTKLLTWAYARGFAPPEADWLKRALDRLRGRDRTWSVPHCLSKWLRGRFRGLGYYLAVYYDMWTRYLGEVRPRLRRGELVLSDRYIQDLRYLHHSRPIAVFPLLRPLLCRLFPRPHVVFFLHNDPEVIASRKDQLTAEQILAFQTTYRRALRGLPVREIKTDRPAEQVAEEITRTILARYFERR